MRDHFKCVGSFNDEILYIYVVLSADADPEPCPIRGPFYFNYSSNNGLCSSHQSKADICSSSDHLRLNFEACPDLPYSNQWRDDLECFANWQDSRNNYFAAKIINHPEVDEIKQYRCFVSLISFFYTLI